MQNETIQKRFSTRTKDKPKEVLKPVADFEDGAKTTSIRRQSNWSASLRFEVRPYFDEDYGKHCESRFR